MTTQIWKHMPRDILFQYILSIDLKIKLKIPPSKFSRAFLKDYDKKLFCIQKKPLIREILYDHQKNLIKLEFDILWNSNKFFYKIQYHINPFHEEKIYTFIPEPECQDNFYVSVFISDIPSQGNRKIKTFYMTRYPSLNNFCFVS